MTKSINLFILITLSVISFDSLKSQDTLHYIFLGHIKKPIAGIYVVDDRIAGIDYSIYNRVWLGGDITGESSLDYETLEYIDGLFDISNPSNQVAWGNHDLRNFNDEWIRQITGRKTYNVHYENGITTVVLNLFIAPDDCEKLNDQFEMLQNICDTIQQSSHLVILTHPNVWKDVPGLPHPGVYSHSNQVAWVANCYESNADFISAVYPMLLEVKNKGITVINVLGDAGARKGKSMISDEEIFFIASGIDHNTEDTNGPDRILIFDHIPETSELTWQFHNLDSLFLTFNKQ